jgi:hypothetical protein
MRSEDNPEVMMKKDLSVEFSINKSTACLIYSKKKALKKAMVDTKDVNIIFTMHFPLNFRLRILRILYL